ncbi:MAG: hypothetical protein GC162_17580 [Planctomycetes bacterium]|nr:hypothetical protein [Planctomycetota bacterium]
MTLSLGWASIARAAGGNSSILTVAPSSVDFGRVLMGQTVTGLKTVTISNEGGDSTTFTASAANNGLSVKVDTTTATSVNGTIDGNSGGMNPTPGTKDFIINLTSNANGSGSTGSKSIDVTLNNTATTGNAADMGMSGTGSLDPDDVITAVMVIVANRDLSGGATVDFGRVMKNTDTTTLNTTVFGSSANDNNATRVNLNNGSVSNGGVTVTRSGGTFLFNAANESASVSALGNFSTTGAKSGSVNVASLLSNAETSITGTPTVDTSVLINYTATAVDNRNLGVLESNIDLGDVLVGFNTASQTATVDGGPGDDNTRTRVTLGNGNVTQNEVTVGGGSVLTFNGSGQTTTRNVVGNFSTSGAKSGVVNIASQLANAETSITGTPTLDNTVNVAFTANAYDAASLTANNGSALDSGDMVSIANAAGAFRSAAFVDHIAVSTGWTVDNLIVGDSIAAGSGTPTASVTFDDAGLLNGLQVAGSLDVTLENNQSITGAADQDLGTLNWSLSHTVSGQSGAQTAVIAAGNSYAGLYGTSDKTLVSTVSFLGGVNANNGPSTTLMTSWRDRTAGEFGPTWPILISDVADVSGNHGDVFVLEMSYDPTLIADEAGFAASGLLYLGWLDGADWVSAISGNIGANTANPSFINFQGSWAASGAGLTLGANGVDTATHTVWAVVDHNSEFAAIMIPEPTTLVSIAVAGMILATARTHRKR